MKTIYWKKIDVWGEFPFNQEIDYRYIEFSPSKKSFSKQKYNFTCDSQVVNEDRLNFVAEHLKIDPKNIKLIKIN